jgi:N-acetylated-alpha-linked acidic dipeptidase
VKAIELAAQGYEAALSNALPRLRPAAAARLNQTIYRTERTLTLAEGLPGREWYKHQIAAPGMYTGYSAKTLPGIREAVEASRWDEARQQSVQVVRVLRAFAAEIDRAAAILKSE